MTFALSLCSMLMVLLVDLNKEVKRLSSLFLHKPDFFQVLVGYLQIFSSSFGVHGDNIL